MVVLHQAPWLFEQNHIFVAVSFCRRCTVLHLHSRQSYTIGGAAQMIGATVTNVAHVMAIQGET